MTRNTAGLKIYNEFMKDKKAQGFSHAEALVLWKKRPDAPSTTTTTTTTTITTAPIKTPGKRSNPWIEFMNEMRETMWPTWYEQKHGKKPPARKSSGTNKGIREEKRALRVAKQLERLERMRIANEKAQAKSEEKRLKALAKAEEKARKLAARLAKTRPKKETPTNESKLAKQIKDVIKKGRYINTDTYGLAKQEREMMRLDIKLAKENEKIKKKIENDLKRREKEMRKFSAY